MSIAGRRGREGKSARWQVSRGLGGACKRERNQRMVVDHMHRTGEEGGLAFAGLIVISRPRPLKGGSATIVLSHPPP